MFQDLRKQAAEAEEAPWFHLRRKEVHGRRLRAISGGFFLGDFVCLPARSLWRLTEVRMRNKSRRNTIECGRSG